MQDNAEGGGKGWKKLAKMETLKDRSASLKEGFSSLRLRLTEASEHTIENLFEKEAPNTTVIAKSYKKEVFGIPLDLVMNKHPGRQIPPIIEKISLYIEKALIKEEGIFRLSGSQTEIEANKELLDQGKDVPFWEMSDHTVCDLLKLYFRTLPQTLLTEELYDCFIAKATISITQKLDVDLAGLLQTLPNNNRYLLKRLLLLLKRITEYESYNKMGISNLALIFGPNLLQAPEGSDGSALIKDMPLINQIAANLITHCESLFKDTHLKDNYIGFLQAKFDYTKKTEGELSFKKDEILWLMEKHDSGWWKGELRGVVGYVPDTFVVEYDFLVQGKPPRKPVTPSAPTAVLSSPPTPYTTSTPSSSVTTSSASVQSVGPSFASQSVRVRPLANPSSANNSISTTTTITKTTQATTSTFASPYNSGNSNAMNPSSSLRKAPSNTISSPGSSHNNVYKTNGMSSSDPASYGQLRKQGVSASYRTPRIPQNPIEAERDRKKERRKVGVRRGSHANPNGSTKPITPTGPDVSLLDKMAVFETGAESNNSDTHSAPTRTNFSVMGENGERLQGSHIVMERMAIFEKTG